MSEPLKQLYVWENNTVQLEHVCGFLRDLLRNLDALAVSVIDSPTPEQELATRRLNLYRPLILCKNHVPYCVSLFTTYLKNAKEANIKLIELKHKTDLFIFLDKHSIKDTLNPLLLRLRRRALRGDDLLKLSVNHSSSEMMSIDAEEERDVILDYPPLKLHSRVNRDALSKGLSSLRKADYVDSICLIVTNVLVDHLTHEKVQPVDKHVDLTRKVLLGVGEDEPKITFNEDKKDEKRKMDAASMWEDTKRNYLPNYEKTFWQNLTNH